MTPAKVKPNTRIIGQKILFFNSIGSTNSFAMELIRQQTDEDGTVIITEFQSDGRGQNRRSWISEPGSNLLFSIILKDVTKRGLDPFLINKMLAVVICKKLSEMLPGQCLHIKWPNDILAGKRKICGILIENSYSGKNLNWCIAGVGINVNQSFEPEKELHACSLKDLSGSDTDREMLLQSLLEAFETAYLAQNPAEYAGLYDTHLAGIGEICTFVKGEARITARLQGCDSDGRLITSDEKGRKQVWSHGEIMQMI